MLNQRPRPITPGLLVAFLGPTGHVLGAAYPRQVLRDRRCVSPPLPSGAHPPLGAAYPRQFAKLLRFMRDDEKDGYLARVAAMVARLGADAAEERAAQSLLRDKVDDLLGELRRGALAPPAEAQMPAVPIPDNTSDARGDDSW